MRVMITGATGFTGSHAARHLQAGGHHLNLLVRNKSKLTDVFPADFLEHCAIVEGDLEDLASIEKALKNCDAVLHCAAMVSLHESDSEAMMRANLGGTQNIVNTALELRIPHILYVSSVSTMYNHEGKTVTEASPLAEVHNGYGKSKLEAEKWVRQQRTQGHPIAIVYPAGITGPQDPGLSSNNLSFLYYLNATTINTQGGQQIIDVRDLALVLRLMIEQRTLGRYIVGGHFLPWPQLINHLETTVGKKVNTVRVPGSALRGLGQGLDWLRRFIAFDTLFTAEAMRYATLAPVASSDKLLKELDIEFRPVEETMRDLVLWAAKEDHIKQHWTDNIRC